MINNTTTVDSYWATTGTQDYLVTIEFLDTASNLYVAILDHVTGLESIPTYTEGVATTGEFSYDSATGKITLGDTVTGVGGSISDSDKITITTNLAYLQKTDITSNSNYDPEVLESAYDNAVLLTRQNRDTINRSMTLSVSDTGQTMELPSKTALANSYLHFDSNGNPEEHVGILPRVYDGEFPYLVNDIVPYGGTFWICITDSTGNTPISGSTYWEVFTDRSNEWNPDINYNTGVAAWYGDVYYKSLQNPNLGNTPVGGTGDTFWQEVNLYGTRWDSGVNYAINDISSISGTLIRSKVDDNMGNPPDITPGATDNFWEVVKTGGAVIVEGETGSAGFSALDLVYFDNGSDDGDITGDAGKLVKADKGSLDKAIITGFALTTGVSTDIVEVQSKGLLSGFVGLTPGERYYLGDAGGYCTRGSVDYQDYFVSVGVAKSSDTMDVNIGLPEATRNQDDGNPVGSIKYFSTYKDRSAYGYLPFAFDNAISQANYSVLFNEIGHIYNAQHVAAGDADLSASGTLFYPTPVPGAYDRVGIPDTATIDSTTGVDDTTELITLTTADYNALHMTRGVLGIGADGVPVKVKLVSGSLPTGLAEDTTYFIRFKTSPDIELYTTEADAINIASTTNRVDLTDAVGTFSLTQEGVYFDDAFQGHWHEAHINGSSTGDGTDNDTARRATSNNSGWEAETIGPDQEINYGTPRVSNESRPKSFISFGYIKAEHITSAGEPISALRYDTGWVANSVWTSQLLGTTVGGNIVHNLSVNLSDLIVKVLISTDGTDTNSFELLSVTRDISDSVSRSFGIMAYQVDTNKIKVITGDEGVMTLDATGTVLNISNQAYYYKVVITKPNLVNTVFDVSSMPKTYDISTINARPTLPQLSGVLQTKEYYWNDGDGTATFELSAYGTEKIEGLDSSIWLGEGTGHIVLTGGYNKDGVTKEWKVREYEDSGSNSNGSWQKNKEGRLFAQHIIQLVYTSESALNATWTYPYTPNGTPNKLRGNYNTDDMSFGTVTNNEITSVRFGPLLSTSTTVSMRVINAAPHTFSVSDTIDVFVDMEERWRA